METCKATGLTHPGGFFHDAGSSFRLKFNAELSQG
jgi:hypothetical protein